MTRFCLRLRRQGASLGPRECRRLDIAHLQVSQAGRGEAIKIGWRPRKGDLIVFVADTPRIVHDALGKPPRPRGQEANLIDPDRLPSRGSPNFRSSNTAIRKSVSCPRTTPSHRPWPRTLPLLDTDPAKGPGPGLRPGAERHRDRRRQHPDPPHRGAGDDLQTLGLGDEESRRQVRFPARRPRIRHAAARRHCLRVRPIDHAHDGRPNRSGTSSPSRRPRRPPMR